MRRGDDGPAGPLALTSVLRSAARRAAGRKARSAARLAAPESTLDARESQQCAAGPDGKRFSKDDWERCSGAAVVDVVAEGWGQGHARASALGVAGMMAMLAAAANGQAEVQCAAPRRSAARRRVGRCIHPQVRGIALQRRSPRAQSDSARSGRGHPERSVVQPSRGHSAARMRADVRRDELREQGLDRGQDGHADVSQRRPLARRPRWAVREHGPEDAPRSQRVRAAASLQMVRRSISDRSERTARGPRRSAC